MTQKITKQNLIVTLWLLLSVSLYAKDLMPSSLFKDGMVLQHSMQVPIWGKTTPSAQVSIKFAEQLVSTTAKEDGSWMVELSSLAASFEPQRMTISSTFENNTERVIVSDVLVGDVWVCSGQSNMMFGYGGISKIVDLSKQSKNIRTFNVKRTVAFEKQDTCEGAWVTEDPSSAVAFTFAYHYQLKADVPVGVILNPWGSSSIEAWMPRDMTRTLPNFKAVMDTFDSKADFSVRISAILDGPRPWSNQDDIFLRRQPNILYNAMMHPLMPYACQGVVWYQGERNTQSMYGEVMSPWWSQNSGMLKYGETLKQWILQYRKSWGNDDLKFMVVMLPGYGKDLQQAFNDPDTTSWAWMRESQLQSTDLPNVNVINTIDLGNLTNIHPKDKLPVGQRVALMAEHELLDDKVLATGPIMDFVEKKRGKLIVHYSNVTTLKTTDGEVPNGFWVANEIHEWYKADAVIEGTTVVLTCKELKKPTYVRYAFAAKPDVNLINEAELPAYPFRTDTFVP